MTTELSPRDCAYLLPRRHGDERAINVAAGQQSAHESGNEQEKKRPLHGSNVSRVSSSSLQARMVQLAHLGILKERHEPKIHVQLLVTMKQRVPRTVGYKVYFYFLVSAEHHDILNDARG